MADFEVSLPGPFWVSPNSLTQSLAFLMLQHQIKRLADNPTEMVQQQPYKPYNIDTFLH
jgi:hypothetical protein